MAFVCSGEAWCSTCSVFIQSSITFCLSKKTFHNICFCGVQIKRSCFLFLHKNVCCGYSLGVPQRGTSNEYPQHMLSWRNQKNIGTFQLKNVPYLELCSEVNFFTVGWCKWTRKLEECRDSIYQPQMMNKLTSTKTWQVCLWFHSSIEQNITRKKKRK